MVKINGKIIGIMVFVVMIFSVLVCSYAENETGNTNTETSNTTNTSVENKTENKVVNTTNTTANTSSGTTKATTNEVQNKKSSNANLSNLGIKPNDFKGFKADVTSYDVEVPKDVASVEIYATVQDKKSSVTGTGKKELRYGLNEFEIVVTAEDGTKKTYTLNIKREELAENTENVPERYTGEGLAKLNINNLELSPKFDTIVYEYTVKYIGEETKLNIDVSATDPYYNIDITGNENLKEGENIINILVSDPDGNNVAVYQVTVNKSLVDEEAIKKEEEGKKNRIILIVAGSIIALIVLIIIIKKIRKRRNEEFEYDDYEDDEDENYSPYVDLDDEKDNNKKENNQLEDFDEDMNYIVQEPELTKEEARKEFLKGYDNEIDEEIKEPKNKKHKGKRFK